MHCMNINQNAIYLDYNATTPVDPRVLEKMLPYFMEHFGNASSAQHQWGWAAERAVNIARKQVASLIHAEPGEIYFTSGATESNNWAIFGVINALIDENPNQKIHAITSLAEHNSVLKAFQALEKRGIEVTYLPVNQYGQIEIEQFDQAIKPHTKLVSFIWVNNEVGSINPIDAVGKICHERKIYFHSDGTQSVGKIPVNLSQTMVDLVSFSGHKIYGPKGVGALYIRSKNPAVQINPLFYGGSQEKGLRSGTLNVTGIVGFGEACALCEAEFSSNHHQNLIQLRKSFQNKILQEIPGSKLNGHPENRSPINLSFTFPGKKIELAMGKLAKLGASTGSACSSGRIEYSHVLKSIGVSAEDAQCTLRLSIGRKTDQDDVLIAVDALKKAFS